MSDLVVFLRARLDEDEQVARAATPGPWSYNPGKVWLDGEAFESFDHSKGEEFVGYGGPSPFRGCVAATGPADHPQSMADAAFVARHDPAHVLAEVDAKRRIIDEHFGFLHPGGYPDRACRQCSDRRTDDDPLIHLERWLKLEPAPCRTVRLLALPYADHPDYREEWRP